MENCSDRIMKTLMILLKDRHYVVNDEYKELENPGQWYQDEFLVMKAHSQHHELLVFAPKSEKLIIDDARSILARVEKEAHNKQSRVLIIYVGEVTFFASESLSFAKTGRYFEFMSEKSLIHPVIYHQLVPRHRCLTSEEEKEVLTKYRIKPQEKHKMLIILKDDPVVQWYQWPIGSVIEITRRWGGEQCPQIVYRVVQDRSGTGKK
jgi:DNA-directed RNA polymerase subunit H (RpoH/RPB5)